MKKSMQMIGRSAVIIGMVSLFSACTTITQEQLDAVEAKADRAMAAAQAAQSAARDAATDARHAQDTADEALACCEANTERFDRLLEQSMKK
jgi:Alanine-zipper, major outer membrane lipoprotein